MGSASPEGNHCHHHHHHCLPCCISNSSTAIPFLPPLRPFPLLPFAIKFLALSPPPISRPPLFLIVGRSSWSLSRTSFDNCAFTPQTFLCALVFALIITIIIIIIFTCTKGWALPTTSSRLTIGCRSLLCVLQVPPRANPLYTLFSFFFLLQNIRST